MFIALICIITRRRHTCKRYNNLTVRKLSSTTRQVDKIQLASEHIGAFSGSRDPTQIQKKSEYWVYIHLVGDETPLLCCSTSARSVEQLNVSNCLPAHLRCKCNKVIICHCCVYSCGATFNEPKNIQMACFFASVPTLL